MSQRFRVRVASLLASYAGQRRGLWGASILRVGFSSVALINYLWHINIWATLWGPRGEIPLDAYRRLSFFHFAPYGWNDATWYSFCVYALSIAFAAIFGAGVCTRITGWLFLATYYASYVRTDLASDAGQQLMILLLFPLCLMKTDAHLCLFKRNKSTSGARYLISTMLHNSARFLIIWQMSMVYFWAAFWKLGGSDWRHGTAMYYVLHMERFAVWPWLSNWLSANAMLVALLTYATLAIQIGFPFLIWNKKLKPLLAAMMIGLHAGIALVMGLVSFSAVMMLADISTLTDAQLERFLKTIRFSAKLVPKALSRSRGASQT